MPQKAKVIEATNFIEDAINSDITENKVPDYIITRLPPEPSGYLHIGHAKNIMINAGTAQKYNGICNLRFDDTNPTKEKDEYIESIKNDITWLGYSWEKECYASSYFEKTYELAEKLILDGKAYVEDLTAEEIKTYRGTLTEPGKDSPYKTRSVEENLTLFRRMRAGEFKEGERVLRAIIDMSSPNINMRDPVIYRIKFAHHHQTGDAWCIYPMYDFAHPIGDAIEQITHSMCDLAFEAHRPLYNWVVENCGFPNRPRQIEYAKLFLKGSILGKRNLRKLTDNGFVDGWDDPRLLTIAGLKRRGVTPKIIKNFLTEAGVSKSNSLTEMSMFEYFIREEFNQTADRAMAVMSPLKVIIDNWEEGKSEDCEIEINPNEETPRTRKVPFTKEIYIEREDFALEPPSKFFRLKPGGEVRLKSAYIVRFEGVDKDDEGNVAAVHCSYDPDTKSGSGTSEKKVKGTIHWVSSEFCRKAELRLYDRLIDGEFDENAEDIFAQLNQNTKTVLKDALIEKDTDITVGKTYQFMRNGYFTVDYDSTEELPVFNLTVALKDNKKK